MSWRPRLVALDVDGTIALDDEVSPRIVDVVARARRDGAYVLLSTGRSSLGSRAVARTLGLTGDVVHVFSNGAVTARLDPDEIVDVVTFDAGAAVRLLHDKVPDVRFAVEDIGVGYRVSAPFPDGELTGDVRVCDLDDLVSQPVTRVVVRQPAIGAEAFLEVVESVGLHGVNYVVGYTAWLDLAPVGVSKASALDAIRARLGIARADTLAIGDGRNDVEMLGWAGRGVAMGDSVDVVVDAADDVTAPFEEDGAAVELERWFGAG